MSDLDARYKQAQTYYRKALQSAGDNATILNNLGYSLIMTHDYRQAEKELKKAVSIDPQMFRARNNYAIALAWQKRYQDAVESLADVVPYEVAYNNVGYIAYLNKDFESAKYFLKKAISTSPTYYAEAAANLEKVIQAMETLKRKGSLP